MLRVFKLKVIVTTLVALKSSAVKSAMARHMCIHVANIFSRYHYISRYHYKYIKECWHCDVSWCFTDFRVLETHIPKHLVLFSWWNYANQKETNLHHPMVHVNVIKHFKAFLVGNCFGCFFWVFFCQNTFATNTWNVANASPSPTAIFFFTPGDSCCTGAVHVSEASVLWWHFRKICSQQVPTYPQMWTCKKNM